MSLPDYALPDALLDTGCGNNTFGSGYCQVDPGNHQAMAFEMLMGVKHADPPAVDLPLSQLSGKRCPESRPFCRTT